MGFEAHELTSLVGRELSRPAPEAARRLAAAIRERVGDATGAVVFYGSCLRKQTAEGVLDFYVLVDDYASALDSRPLAWASAALPPTVFYVECESAGERLRAKYALLSFEDFARGAAPGGWRTGIWARFCQPSLAVYARDDAALRALEQACAASLRTAVECIAPLLPERFRPEEFWQRLFRETYDDEALGAALRELSQRSGTPLAPEGGAWRWSLTETARHRARRVWRARRPVRKLVYVAQLVKTAFTFGDWLPYVLWKLERHSGNRLEYSERQRRHPFLFAWPLLLRALWSRDFR
jgi:hypothetical protein